MKKILIIITSLIVIIGILTLIASFIVIDDCASPCRHVDDPDAVCMTVCEKITLLDKILGQD